jgi:plastocyanin
MKKALLIIGAGLLLAGCSAKTAKAPASNTGTKPAASSQPAASPDAMMKKDDTSDQESDANTIKISNYMFAPDTLTVKAGAEVTVVNTDTVKHNLVADDESFKVDLLDENESSVFTAPSKPGTYAFHCEPHAAKMKGTLIVQ